MSFCNETAAMENRFIIFLYVFNLLIYLIHKYFIVLVYLSVSIPVYKNLLILSLQELQESFNYGLFLPPLNGKAGKFLDEERLLSEYPMSEPIGYLEVSWIQFKFYTISSLFRWYITKEISLRIFVSFTFWVRTSYLVLKPWLTCIVTSNKIRTWKLQDAIFPFWSAFPFLIWQKV